MPMRISIGSIKKEFALNGGFAPTLRRNPWRATELVEQQVGTPPVALPVTPSVTGEVTGEVTGLVTGQVAGQVTGEATGEVERVRLV